MSFSEDLLKAKYRSAPACVQLFLSPLLGSYRSLRAAYDLIYPRIWQITGYAGHDHARVNILYFGDVLFRNYLTRTLLSGNVEQRYLGRSFIWHACKLATSFSDVDILIYDLPHRISMWLGQRECWCIPAWVHADMDFSLLNNSSKNFKETLRRIQRHGYTFELTSDKARIAAFYQDMYLPYVSQRYPGELLLVTLENLFRESNLVELLLVRQDNVSVAGVLFYHAGGAVHLKCVGVQEGREDLVKAGVIQAGYYFMFAYLKDKVSKVGLGGTRGFFNDGLMSFKKKWGLRITHRHRATVRVCPLRRTQGTMEFLRSNPCIALEGDELVGVVFMEKKAAWVAGDVGEYARYLFPGLKRVIVYSFDDLSEDVAGAMTRAGFQVRQAKDLCSKL